jgi:aldehyde dehydrogenase (NAD+)
VSAFGHQAVDPHPDQIYLGGGWRTAHSTARTQVINPATEQSWAQVPAADEQDVDKAVRAAYQAFTGTGWRDLSAHRRAEYLLRLADELEKRSEMMSHVLTAENGSPVAETAGAAAHSASVLRYNASLADVLDEPDLRPFPAGGAHTLVCHVPVGVAALIAPWNFPLTLVMVKLAPALLAGCTVVVKPAPETPMNLRVLIEAVEATGIPAGVVNVVTGGRETGEALVRHPLVSKVAFTGSTVAGRSIARTCGELLRPVTLELGGKSAAIVLPDADLDQVAGSVLRTCLRNTGQTCYACTRILAPHHSYDRIIDLVTDVVAAAPQGDPFDQSTVFGPVVSERQRARVEQYLAIGRSEGARVTTGGGRPANLPVGWYVRPTVFRDVDSRMRIAQEEIFGPVLTVIPYADVDDAVRIANDSAYGLGGSVFGADTEHATTVAQRMDTGSVGINFFASNHAAPFSGRKDSGLGVEFGLEGLLAFCRTQSIHRRG